MTSDSDTFELASDSLRVEFVRRGDRFQHTVYFRRNEDWVAVWKSLDGTPDEAWPPSPPWQEVSVHYAAAPALLAVGMAGKTHWSLVVECDAESGLSLDVAARVQGEPGPLGSHYVSCDPAMPHHDPPLLIVPQHDGGPKTGTLRWRYGWNNQGELWQDGAAAPDPTS